MKHSRRLWRKVILFCATTLFLSGFSAIAQKVKPEDVPQVVKNSFLSEYPNAKVKEWQIKGEDYWVSYKDDGTQQTTVLSNSGTLVETRILINKQELPGFIVDYVATEYPGCQIGSSELVQKPKTKDLYDVVVKKAGAGTAFSSVLSFSSDGKLISRKDPDGFAPVVPEEKPQKNEPKKEVVKATPKSADDSQTMVNDKKTKTKEKELHKESKKSAENSQAMVNDKKTKTKENEPQKESKKSERELEEKSTKTKSKKDNFPENIISENSVPPIVKKNFVKKFPKAEMVKWFNKKGDTLYTIKCVFREQPNEIQFAASGRWLSQRIEQDEKTIFPAVQKYLDKTYRKYQLVSSVKTIMSDKNGGFEVKIIELKNKKKKLETTIFFDKLGKLIKTVDPDYGFDAKEEKITSADRKLEQDYLNSVSNVETDEVGGLKVDEKELPSDLISYVYANYPGMRINTAYLRDIDDLGTCYEVSVAREGINQEPTMLIFDKLGKYIKNANDAQENIEKGNAENSPQSEDSKPKGFAPPDTVANAFKAKYPKVTKVDWEEAENGDFVAAYSDGTGAHKSCFAADGAWIKISTDMNVEAVPAGIKTYIEKSYKGYKIVAARNVKKVDKKTYYEVDVLHKKTDDKQTIEFNQGGKPTTDSGLKK